MRIPWLKINNSNSPLTIISCSSVVQEDLTHQDEEPEKFYGNITEAQGPHLAAHIFFVTAVLFSRVLFCFVLFFSTALYFLRCLSGNKRIYSDNKIKLQEKN